MYELKLKAWDEGVLHKTHTRNPALLHVAAIGDAIEGILCDSNIIIGKGTKFEYPAYRITLYNPPIVQFTNNIAKDVEVYQKDIMEFKMDLYYQYGSVEFEDDRWAIVDNEGDYMIGLWDCIENYSGKVIGNTFENIIPPPRKQSEKRN